MASANFTVNSLAVPPEVAVAASSTVNLALVSTTGVRTVEWSIVGNHAEAATNPTITPAGSPSGATAAFTMPSGAAQGYLVQCVVNGGVDESGRAVSGLTKRALVGVVNTAPVPAIPFVVGESDERSLTHGYVEALNNFVNSGGSGLAVSGTPSAGDVVTWSGSAAVWASADAYDITAFSASTATLEIGATATTPAFTATHNHTPTSLVLTNNDNGESKNVVGTPTSFTSSQNYTKTANNASVTFTLTGSDGITPDTRQASISWRPRVYHGIGAAGGNSEAFIEALASSALQSSRATSYTDNATGSNHLYWAAPASYGTPTFTVGGFEGGFSLVSSTISVTNANGVNQNYQLWVSDVAGLGSTNVVVS